MASNSNKPETPKDGHRQSTTILTDPVGYSTNSPPTDRPARVFIHGVFDLFHVGHVQFLKLAKTTFPDTYLIAGVTTDRDTIRVKGLTVIPAADRANVVTACRYVDEVIPNCEPVLSPEFMEKQNIDYFAHHDTADRPGKPDPYRFVKEQSKFLVIPRGEEGGSTTNIISRIIRNNNQYILRQLKNGARMSDLGISWARVQWIKMCAWLSSVGGLDGETKRLHYIHRC